ncbi:MAG: iron ABC transporter substrate-binding protein, partial [Rhizobiales bacterium]|nr:iron ABC transporter substrate-binding protein [Hyphomicrobiales bacterium]
MTLGVTVALAAIASAHAETRFLDHRNKEIVFEKPPEKIVSMFASGPLVYYAVEGNADHIAGVHQKGMKMYQTSIYGELIPQFLKMKSNVAGEGFMPNVEAILEVKPDAVLQWTFDPKIIEPLERVGLKVVG